MKKKNPRTFSTKKNKKMSHTSRKKSFIFPKEWFSTEKPTSAQELFWATRWIQFNSIRFDSIRLFQQQLKISSKSNAHYYFCQRSNCLSKFWSTLIFWHWSCPNYFLSCPVWPRRFTRCLSTDFNFCWSIFTYVLMYLIV